MKKSSKLKKYNELFKRNITSYLAPDVAIKTTIYPVEGQGAVFEFEFNKDSDNSETISRMRPTVGRVLSDIPQNLIGGNTEGITFGGTNLLMEGNRILIIKGEDYREQ